MGQKHIDLKKLKKAFYTTISYYEIKRALDKKNETMKKLCEKYQKNLLKSVDKKTLNSEQLEKKMLEIAQKVGKYRIEYCKENEIYELKDKLIELEKHVIVKNDNPLHDNMPPEKVTILRNMFEKIVAKNGFKAFDISHDEEGGCKSSFEFFKRALGKELGKPLEDMIFVARDGEIFVAYKALAPKELKNFSNKSYIFNTTDSYKKFAKENGVFEYSMRNCFEKKHLDFYVASKNNFNLLSKYAYFYEEPFHEDFDPKVIDALWKTLEYKNAVWKKIEQAQKKDI